MGASIRPNASVPLEESIGRIRSGIEEACLRAGRSSQAVLLVAVTKTVPIDEVLAAQRLGLSDFAENYARELAQKSEAVRARWHFIGKLQEGTAPRVADHADVVHSAEPGRALERVARRAARYGRTIRCLVQVDFTEQRQGVPPDLAEEAVRWITALQGIEVVGLMTLPPWTGDAEATRPFFRRLRELRDEIRPRWPRLAELSMGMSGDYGVAVEEGATMVRVGTALFGDRPRGRAAPPVERRAERGPGPR